MEMRVKFLLEIQVQLSEYLDLSGDIEKYFESMDTFLQLQILKYTYTKKICE